MKPGKSALLQPAFFLLRRLVLAFAGVVFRESLITQLLLVWGQSIIAICIIGFANPFKTRAERWNEYFNEAIITGVLISIMCTSGMFLDSEKRALAGYFACGLITVQLAVSLLQLAHTTLI